LNAIQALSQLSYGPTRERKPSKRAPGCQLEGCGGAARQARRRRRDRAARPLARRPRSSSRRYTWLAPNGAARGTVYGSEVGFEMGVLRLLARDPVTVQHDDRQLAARAREGDEAAFAVLVRRHQGGVRRCAARILGDEEEARDIAQLAFVRAWENLSRYDPTWSFSTWLYRIASNLAIDVLRSRDSRDRTHAAHLRLVGDSVGPSAPRDLAEGEVRRIFAELAATLSPAQRTAFVLREVEGLSTDEVAQAMGCTEATVRNHVFQARATLRRELAIRYPEYLPRGGGR
jgi:RNA polymerase sigma-70 factor (ECF subfamily)